MTEMNRIPGQSRAHNHFISNLLGWFLELTVTNPSTLIQNKSKQASILRTRSRSKLSFISLGLRESPESYPPV